MRAKKVAYNYLVKPFRFPGSTFRPNTFRGAEIYFEAAKLVNRKVVRLRDPGKWTESPETKLDPRKGYDVWDMSEDPIVRDAIGQGLRDLARAMAENDDSRGRKPFLQQVPIDLQKAENEPYLKLTKHTKILATISDYFGMLPVRQGVSLWYSPNEAMMGRSQLYHLDSEDKRQVKVFLFLEEVDMNSGPLHVVSSGKSRLIWEKLTSDGIVKQKNNKVKDEHIFDAANTDPGEPIIGKAGTMALVDTCNCYHYGSRPSPEGARPRKVLYIQYTTPFAKNLRFIARRKENGSLDSMLELDGLDKL